MADSGDDSHSPGPPLARRRAPTITIDTTAVSAGNDTPEDVDDPQRSQQQLQPLLHQRRPSMSPISPLDDGASPSTLTEPPFGFSQRGHRYDLRVDTSFESRDSRPTSPHNVSTPIVLHTSDRGFLSVPSNPLRSRQSSLDSEDASRSLYSGGETTVVASSSTQAEKYKISQSNDRIMNDPTALQPDVGNEADFEVDDNPFAFAPGELGKMFDPKNPAAFYQMGGLRGLEKGLRTNCKAGLSADETTLDGYVSFEEATMKHNKPGQQQDEEEGETAAAAAAASPGARTTSRSNQHGERFQDRYRVFRDNRLPEKKGKSLLHLMWITYNDKVLILLSIAAAISLAVGLYQTFGQKHEPGEPNVEWVEGVAIIVAIAIVVIVGSLNDYQKERQFAKLNKKKQDRNVKVIRSGTTMEISVFDIMVGDVVHLEPGDLIPVDGILIEGFDVKCDESQTTGESDIIKKRSGDEVYDAIQNHESLKHMDPFMQSGAKVMEGVGTFLVTSTGVHSSYGKTLMALNDDPEMTPLQAKLNVIATYIAKLGGAAGLFLFLILFLEFLARLPHNHGTPAQKGQGFLNIVIVVVTIIVVAVPEGLPLAVTLALAFATTRMLKDANLVRHLKACEVMGNATTICSDKTGTLTQNKMQVVTGTVGTSLRFGGARLASSSASSPGDGEDMDVSMEDSAANPTEFVKMLSGPVKDLLLKSIALNSTVFEGEVDGEKTFIGSKTETALLLFARAHLGMGPVSELRESAMTLRAIPFDSGRKCMGIVTRLDGKGGARLYVKGASEILLGKCTQVLRDPSVDASTAALSDDKVATVNELITAYAKRSLRTIGICYRDFESWPPRPPMRRSDSDDSETAFEDLFVDMTFVGVVGIQDPLRDGVYDAVRLCQRAGVVVRMVTGDNRLTARAIASECGILQPDSIVMEGPEFRNLSKLKQTEIIPRLHVLARSSPEDKRILVKRLKDMGEIVAVTGDGTNDAPALKTADVGFSMGIAGTEVAKEASAIILMDDNFASIVKALKWGRAVNDAVKRFLQFQLTVNITAVMLTFVSAVSSDEERSVLSAVQLLWVNLIMDTLAALALATDPPQDSVLDRKPEAKGASIISTTMWKMIVGQALYQLLITLLLYYGSNRVVVPLLGGNLAPEDVPTREDIATLVFNTFVWMQIFNQWNNRRLDNKFNIFEGLTRNWFFIAISALMSAGQVIIIFYGGDAFHISENDQKPVLWAIALVLGFISIPIGVAIRLIPDSFILSLIPESFKRRALQVPGLTVTDEEMNMYPAPLANVRDELQFLRRMKGGRLNNLKFAIQHPREMIHRSRSQSRSRSSSVGVGVLGAGGVGAGAGESQESAGQPQIPMARQKVRSRSNSALGAPTVMAGIVAAGVAAGWSPVGRVSAEELARRGSEQQQE